MLVNPCCVSNKQFIVNVQTQASVVLDALIPSDAHIILLDYPHHPNVGDSLIWLGEIAYLNNRGLKPSYVCDYQNYNVTTIKKIHRKNSIILLHGGGNFGNLWIHLHKFKLQVLKDFPFLPVIQLPQTVYFEGDKYLAETVNAIKQHSNFTLLVRCYVSLAFAKQHFSCAITLCPDMAFFIGSIDNKKISIVDRFILSRTDVEKPSDSPINSIQFDPSTSVQIEDWLTISKKEFLIERFESHYWIRKLFSRLDRNNQVLLYVWHLLAKARLKRGVAQLSKGKVVITDRLHGHILCLLLNKPHVLMDNTYGKLSHFYKTWTYDSNIAIFAGDQTSVNKASSELAETFNTKTAVDISDLNSSVQLSE